MKGYLFSYHCCTAECSVLSACSYKAKSLTFLLGWTWRRGPGPACGCTALHQSLGIFSLLFSRSISSVNVQSFLP